MSAHQPLRRLPVRAVVGRSFAYAWERRDYLVLSYMIYAVIASITALIGDYGFGPETPAGTTLMLAVDEVFGIALAVGIHRLVLLNEPPGRYGLFRWDRHFARYFLAALVLDAAVLGFLALYGTLGTAIVGPADAAANPSPAAALASLLMLVGLVAAAAAFVRLLLVLPAGATGQKLSLGPIWQASHGNGFRLLAAALLVLIPFALVEASLVGGVTDPAATQADAAAHLGVASNIALALVLLLERIVFTIMLSLEYDVLVRGGGPAQVKR